MGDVFGWDRASQRFRDLETGKFVSERAVRDGVDRLADLTSQRMGASSARFRAGQINAAEWQTEMQSLVKASHIASALAAYGGRDQMTPQRWGLVGARVRQEYAYLRAFAADVLSGRQRLNGRLDARARLYGQSIRQTYTDVRRRESAGNGMQWERNIIGAAEHCRECIRETERGWVQIGTLVPPGRRTCRGNCRCTLSYSKTAAVDEAA